MPSQSPISPPTLTPALPGTPSVATIESLRGQAQALQDQLTALIAHAKGLEVQSRYAKGADRADVRGQLADVRAQIGQVSGALANVRTQIAVRQGPGVTMGHVGLPPFTPRWIDQDDATAIIIVFFLAVLMPISLGITRRLWRRVPQPSAPPYTDVISPRLERLEQAVDAIAIEIERVSEGQRFLTKVFGASAARGVREAPGVHASDDASRPGDSSPLRELGAGSVEPIHIPERQSVRASNTPH